MVKRRQRPAAVLDHAFAALSDPTRRAIVDHLAKKGEASVGELAGPFDISWPAVTRHIKVLEEAGLVRRRIDGRVHHMRLTAESLRDVVAWAERYRSFWDRRFRELEEYLAEEDDR